MLRVLILLLGLVAAFMLTACTGDKPLSEAEIEGQWLYATHCAECHDNPQLELHKQPPNLHGLFSSRSLPSGAPATDEQVRRTIIDGKNTMPAFAGRLRQQDVDSLITYLHRLR